eukprot:3501299-Alexandrium_andersonii.AAC.1
MGILVAATAFAVAALLAGLWASLQKLVARRAMEVVYLVELIADAGAAELLGGDSGRSVVFFALAGKAVGRRGRGARAPLRRP